MGQLYKRKGNEILVNAVTSGDQSANHVAALSTGGFVVVWTDASMLGTDTSESGVKAQRFDANGAKIGAEFLVNTAIDGFQGQPKATGLDGGRFVVTWTNLNGDDGDGADSGIKGQVFNADGTPSGAEFLVNTSVPEIQLAPAIATLGGGGFVICWTDGSGLGGDTDNSIKLQRFDSTGAKVGGEFLANTVTAGPQTASTLTALASGGFAAAWVGPGVVKCQVFDALGAMVGAEQQVNATPLSAVLTPSMAPVGAGFVVVWSHSGGVGDSDGFDVAAQLFDAAGAKIGGEFAVNSTIAGDQRVPEVRGLSDGHFLVTWTGPGEFGSDTDIFGQIFTAAGDKYGVEFVISLVTYANQGGVRIAVLPSGDIAITWTDDSGIGLDDSGSAIKMQLLTEDVDGFIDLALSELTLSETTMDNVAVATLSATGALNTSFTYEIVSDSTGGAFRIDGDRLVVDDNYRLDFETHPDAELRFRVTDLNGNVLEETWILTVTDVPIEARYSAGDEFMVATDDSGFNNPAAITALASGGFVVVTRWSEIGVGQGLRGQIYDAAGAAAGAEFDFSLDQQAGAALALTSLPSGGFLIVYQASDPGIGTHLRAQLFDAGGGEVGDDFQVSTTNNVPLSHPAVALLDSGNFVVSWTLPVDEPGGSGAPLASQIAARLFDPDGDPIGGEFRVNTGIDNGQMASSVAALPGGGFAIAWREADASGERIEAQLFDSAGVKVGGELVLDSSGLGHPVADYALTALESGLVLASWVTRFATGPDVYEITARFIDPADGTMGDVFYLVAATLGPELEIAAMPGGGFVLAASSLDHVDPALDDIQTFGLIFDAAGARVGEGFMAPQSTEDEESGPLVTALAGGDIVIAWARTFLADGAFTSDAYARIFSPKAPAIVGTAGPDTLIGTAERDLILGLDGDDLLVGGAGDDVMDGAAGDDAYLVEQAGDLVLEQAGGGNDIVYATLSYVLAAGSEVESLSVTNHAATAAIHFAGNEFANGLYGNDGVNILNGGGGADLMAGFGGDDLYIVDQAGDVVIEHAGGGRDSVYSLVSYALASGVEVETLSVLDHGQTGAIDFFGNEFANALYGNDGVNILSGGGGGDFLAGFGGDDIFIVDQAGDVVHELAGGGNDIVYALASHALAAGAEVEALSVIGHGQTIRIDLTGNGFANKLYGNAGTNLLSGGDGNDLLAGFGGADIFVFNATLGAGFDTLLDFASATDRIALDDSMFAGLTSLPASAFVVTNAGAQDADDRIIYDSGAGALFFDADGNGSGASVLFALVQPGTALTVSDFMTI